MKDTLIQKKTQKTLYTQCSLGLECLFRGLWLSCFWLYPATSSPPTSLFWWFSQPALSIHADTSLARAIPHKSEVATGLGNGKQEKRSLLAASVPRMAASVIRAVQRVLEHGCIPVSRALVLELWESWAVRRFLTQRACDTCHLILWENRVSTSELKQCVKLIIGICHGFWFKCALESMQATVCL